MRRPILLLVVAASLAQAQDRPTFDATRASAYNSALASGMRTLAPVQPPEGQTECARFADAATQQRCSAAVQEQFAYTQQWFAAQAAELQLRKQGFSWHLVSTKIVFALVVLVVLSGLGFSALQFYLDLHPKTRGLVRHAQESPDAPTTTIDVGLDHLKVSSPILGVIILAMSITFFYLYLKFVYPIQELGQQETTSQATK